MHVFTHVRPEMLGQSGMPGNEYADGMIEHDGHVGQLLKALDDLGIADNTIVVYTTDNGPNQFSWPDAAHHALPLARRTPTGRAPSASRRWSAGPATSSPGRSTTEMVSGLDWFPTLLAAAGDPDIKDELLPGRPVGDKDFKVHLDGYNQLPLLTGETERSAREEFAYFDDDGVLVAYRHRNWKAVFCEMPAPGGFEVWYKEFDCLRIPKLFNLRMDPYERADVVSDQYDDWRARTLTRWAG